VTGQPGSLEAASALIAEVYAWLTIAVVLLGRPLAILSVVPLFARVGLPGFMRTAIAAALVIPVWSPLARHMQDAPGGLSLSLLIVKEVLVGIALGCLLGVPFWILISAGEFLDQMRGEQGRLSDAGGDDVSVTGTLLVITGIAVFVVSGGLETLVHALYASWALWPPGTLLPALDARSPVLLLGLLDKVMLGGFELAFPGILCMLLAETTMLVIGRMAPQIHLDDVAIAARNLIFVVFVPLYVAYLVFYMRRDDAIAANALALMRSAFAP